jgi:hypothetical protein
MGRKAAAYHGPGVIRELAGRDRFNTSREQMERTSDENEKQKAASLQNTGDH